MISEEAQAAFRRALAMDAAQPKARFYLATALGAGRQMEDAAAAWQDDARRPAGRLALAQGGREQAADEAARLAGQAPARPTRSPPLRRTSPRRIARR